MKARNLALGRIALAALVLAPLGAAALPSPSQARKGALGAGAEELGAPVGADDFVTGGGWIDDTPSGALASFGFVVDGRGDALRGRVNFVDHDEGVHVRAESITGYAEIDSETRRVEGTARIDGEPGFTFTLTVRDAAEPARDTDTFSIQLSSGYDASGTLVGGNIQLHTD